MINLDVAGSLKDTAPQEAILREQTIYKIRKTLDSFGYVPVETPHIERLETISSTRNTIEVSNTKGDKGKLALRSNLDEPLTRFIAKHINELGTPFKCHSTGSIFLSELTKGLQESTQITMTTVGTENKMADFEIVQAIHNALCTANLPDFTIELETPPQKPIHELLKLAEIKANQKQNSEFKFSITVDGLEHLGQISSGKRYNNLISRFSKLRMPGVIASIDLELIITILKMEGQPPQTRDDCPIPQ